MGGKKKLTLKQMERMRVRKGERKEGKSGGAVAEKKPAGIIPPDAKSEKVIGEIKKMRVLTPYMVASRFNLRLSVAKGLLRELEQRGILEYVSGGENIKIYKLPS
ncbi:MAG: 30S ribosomal protein S25e [Candidatus Bathyarchaeota archaeon BA1]|nr:MAG: 30S ribosomal protein S25e [Candidatus Bathyarchaeota archaeon BA1]